MLTAESLASDRQAPEGEGMWYIGIDAHKLRCSMVAKNGAGKLVARRVFPHTREGWTDALSDAPKGSKVALECVGWYQPIVDLLDTLGFDAKLVHARDVALIAKSKKKTDKRDATTLCDLLRADFLPTAHIPPKETRELRELTRHLDSVGHRVIAAKNTIQRLLERAWVILPEVKDLFGKEGRAFLAAVKVSPSQRIVLDALLFELDQHGKVRANIEHHLARLVKDDDDVNLLLGMDGLNLAAAATLRAEIDTATRFANKRKIRSNFGLAPSVRDSADVKRRGHITKQGSGVVRKVLVQGTMHFVRHNPAAKAKSERLSKESGKGIARVAVAAYMLDVAYQVLKTRTPYRYARPELVEEKRKRIAQLAATPQPLCVS